MTALVSLLLLISQQKEYNKAVSIMIMEYCGLDNIIGGDFLTSCTRMFNVCG